MNNDLLTIFDSHSDYLDSADTNIKKRILCLQNLKKIFLININEIYEALKLDLNKSKFEAYHNELKPILEEFDWFIRNLKRYMKPKKICNQYHNFFSSKNRYTRKPYGVSLLITQSGLPMYKFFIPFIGLIACGNTVFVKLPMSSTNCNKIIKKIVSSIYSNNIVYFLDEYISNDDFKELLDLNFDLVFFIGTQSFSKTIIRAFATKPTKLVIETHSKCPIIIDETANIEKAASESVWGKSISAGQFNFSPDYVVIHESVVNTFIKCFKSALNLQYGGTNEEFLPRIVSKKKYDKLVAFIEEAKRNKKLLCGGNVNASILKIEPTLISVDNLKSPLLTSEIKGTILPVVVYNTFSDIVGIVKHNENPSSIYFFTKSKERIKDLFTHIETKFFIVNGVLSQVGRGLPLGGCKRSGNLEYGRKNSILSFSYRKFLIKIINSKKVKYANNWSKKENSKKFR